MLCHVMRTDRTRMERSKVMDDLAHCRVTGIHRLAMSAPDIAEMERFYRAVWLLRPSGRDGDYLAFRTAMAVHDDILIAEGERRLDHIAFSIESEDRLSRIAARLRDAGIAVRALEDADLLRSDTMGMAAVDPEGREVRLVVPAPDGGSVAPSESPLAPAQLGHLVLWTAAQAESEAFYALLGFQVTDRTHMGMSFLRCNADHHTLALVRNESGKSGIQHIAFDVGTIDNVMRNFARLREAGLDCVWGVGRHGPGNNIFSYYADPAGNFVEYYGDMEEQPERFPATEKFWGPEHKGDIWGVAGMPPQTFRQ